MSLALLGVALIDVIVVTHTSGHEFPAIADGDEPSAHLVVLWLIAGCLDLPRSAELAQDGSHLAAEPSKLLTVDG